MELKEWSQDELIIKQEVGQDVKEMSEEQRAKLIRDENDYKVQLSQLEDNLLYRLANSEGDILEDIELIENLEDVGASCKQQ